jgi:hypothetical protein
LARWFEARLQDSLAPPSANVRLYGLEVIDADALDEFGPAARVSFVAEAGDLSELFELPDAWRVREFDAAAVVTHPWFMTPQLQAKPGEYPVRRRARVVVVTTRGGSATVTRFDDDPGVVVCSPAA